MIAKSWVESALACAMSTGADFAELFGESDCVPVSLRPQQYQVFSSKLLTFFIIYDILTLTM